MTTSWMKIVKSIKLMMMMMMIDELDKITVVGESVFQRE